jgi:NADPH:quinone reductase-like Zn-dependent oxidoreductase
MQPLGSDTRHFPLLARVSLALRSVLIIILPMPRSVRFHEVGDASVLKLEELPKPEPKEGQVLLKVEAGKGFTLLGIVFDPEHFAPAKKFVTDRLANGAFKPLIAKTFKLDEIVEAHRYMESNEQIGKIALSV